mmetsp:Transcript_14035/g.31495  ORF Transcript_14035/g.31495 Transcript_14035/m.31495 type:complete len:117 (+) Transcript_14035:438-788(+)
MYIYIRTYIHTQSYIHTITHTLIHSCTHALVGAREVSVFGDSELVIRQMQGKYKVKNPGMLVLHAAVIRVLAGVNVRVEYHHVRRELNAAADDLSNVAMLTPGRAEEEADFTGTGV